MADNQQAVAETPESNISPKTQPSREEDGYFPASPEPGNADEDDGPELPTQTESGAQIIEIRPGDKIPDLVRKSKDDDLENDSDASATTPGDTAPSPGSTSEPPSRKMSISSVTFRQPTNPSLPQGLKKKPLDATRRRAASPPHRRFQSHVAFDNIPLGESTDYNPIAFTLNAKHDGYQSTRRSRTFMVGVDDNAYSDHALQWLLSELVDDGDEVICVRVIETQMRLTNTAYQEAAQLLMDNIQSKNKKNLAISLVLEYAVGKLHNTFQHLIKIYQPSMLIVGTKGRSLDSVSSAFFNRSSFSKYCLQYSPVPVVVVRPTEKREKKRLKRAQDPARQNYLQMLPGQKHEADSENSSVYELEPNISAAEEAHRVAVANGLPAKYDPTLKPIDTDAVLRYASSKARPPTAVEAPSAEAVALAATGRLPVPEKGDDSESEFEEEFEVTSGEQALKKERLHVMESNEGAVLKEMQRKASADDSSESDDGEGGAKTEKQ
ncbi:hypothetical protein BKA67DRAFT_77421 [Truncatella angustata]|uniref:UspA domain-containing protein n=1 Tax=Truncatella angustata TaxID=152316 RepID=A0A9P9A5T9_9PEZI|nr:uncharacterized protein BKA67DRAFT_77421 [Truncatella angustata]KAH6661174.1 hypothetical protein BKA67DRAFT_77421 [Truncatella angustata]